jgi:DinB superfamily
MTLPMSGSAESALTNPEISSLRSILKSQHYATLTMLRQAVERCPEGLWTDATHPNAFWHVAYHTLCCAHMYLHANHHAFQPWQKHRDEYQFMGRIPTPPHRPPRIGEPYTKAEVLEYLGVCEGFVDEAVDRMDLGAAECGFPWYTMSKLEHQFVSIRHIQHHAAQLADRLRAKAGVGVDWLGAGSPR